MWVGQTEFVEATSSLYNGHRYPVKIINHEPKDSQGHQCRLARAARSSAPRGNYAGYRTDSPPPGVTRAATVQSAS
jgi:hypothetical protein